MGSMIERREFLAATAGGALAVPPAARDAKAVRVGVVGVGTRGTSLLRTLLDVPGAEVAAVADIDDNALARAQKICLDAGRAKPEGFARGPQDFRRMVERKDLDAVLVATPWEWHAPMMLAAMDAGKYAATEVPAAVTLEECEALVEKNQRTGRRATMLENWVYRREPLAVLTMARAGLLGEIVHCESGYGHDVRSTKFRTAGESRGRGELAWRGEHSTRRNGNLYPTHQFAPAAMLMDVNHGVRIERLVAMGSVSRGMSRYAADLWGAGHALASRSYLNGDRTTVLLQLSDGRAIMQFHQTQSWNPRDDGHKYLGTKGMVRWPFPEKGSIWVQERHWDRKTLHAPKWHPLDPFLDEFDHPVWKAYGREARAHASAHDGSDWLELRGFIESVRHRTEPPVPMEDAATWSAIAALSEKSIAGGSAPVAVPDFTRGKWKSSPKFELKWNWT
jgi:predicted dehydrogenase